MITEMKAKLVAEYKRRVVEFYDIEEQSGFIACARVLFPNIGEDFESAYAEVSATWKKPHKCSQDDDSYTEPEFVD